MILGDAKPEAATQAKHYYVKRPGGCDFTVSLQAAERDPAPNERVLCRAHAGHPMAGRILKFSVCSALTGLPLLRRTSVDRDN